MSEENLYDQKLGGLHHTVGFVNPLEKEYKPLLALKSFHRMMNDHQKWQMKVIGFGSMYKDIQSYIMENDLGTKIMLYGSLSHKEIYDVFKRVDIVIIPSTHSDENDVSEAISAMGAPMVIHSEHKMIGENKINQALIPHDGSELGLAEKLELVINSVQSFDNKFIREQRFQSGYK